MGLVEEDGGEMVKLKLRCVWLTWKILLSI